MRQLTILLEALHRTSETPCTLREAFNTRKWLTVGAMHSTMLKRIDYDTLRRNALAHLPVWHSTQNKTKDDSSILFSPHDISPLQTLSEQERLRRNAIYLDNRLTGTTVVLTARLLRFTTMELDSLSMSMQSGIAEDGSVSHPAQLTLISV